MAERGTSRSGMPRTRSLPNRRPSDTNAASPSREETSKDGRRRTPRTLVRRNVSLLEQQRRSPFPHVCTADRFCRTSTAMTTVAPSPTGTSPNPKPQAARNGPARTAFLGRRRPANKRRHVRTADDDDDDDDDDSGDAGTSEVQSKDQTSKVLQQLQGELSGYWNPSASRRATRFGARCEEDETPAARNAPFCCHSAFRPLHVLRSTCPLRTDLVGVACNKHAAFCDRPP
jgi:hypothetical protein